MATLGDLERMVMDLLWDVADALPANELRSGLAHRNDVGEGKEVALTTVLTVLSRLESKGFVTRDRRVRPHLYRATTTRADHIAELMHEMLGAATDREAVLARFVGQVKPDEVDTLRRMLDNH